MKKIVLASNNQGKLAEFNHMFTQANLPFEIVPQSDFNIDDADETGLSFVENAILKARHASKISGLPAIADDSGLAVPCLGGAPGIYSARFAGDHGNDALNNAKLLQELLPHRNTDKPVDGYFVCVLAFVQHADDPLPVIAQGLWHGEILEEITGENGFGYDPLFWIASLQKSSAQLAKSEKSSISHRAIAMQDLLQKLV